MKTKARYASNKIKLAQLLGISRQWLYEFAKLPDSPAPRPDGMHSVEKWRRFLAKHSSKVQGGTEKERLQVALLQARLRREELEYAELDNSIRESITREIGHECVRVVEVLKTQVWRMPDELSGRFSGLAPMQIYKLFKSELHERFRHAQCALEKLQAQSKRKTRSKKDGSNIVEFRTAAAMGGH
jgi:hypothetical protein